MLDDIKSALNDFADIHKDELTERNKMGITKILWEIDLLEEEVTPSKSKPKKKPAKSE